MHQIGFRLGIGPVPDPAVGIYSDPPTPMQLDLRGPICKTQLVLAGHEITVAGCSVLNFRILVQTGFVRLCSVPKIIEYCRSNC